MKRILITLLSAVALMPAMAGDHNTKPWGWATCADETGTAYTLSGGCFDDARTITLKALGSGTADNTQITNAIAQNDIIIFDGSNGEFTIDGTMKLGSTKNKTIIGINNARLCTKFYLTDEDNAYLAKQGLEGLSSTDQYTGTLPDGTTLTCDRRAFFTKKAIMELQYKKTGTYSLPNNSGIFHIQTSSENIIIRNLSLIGPGAVDIDGDDLITNQGKHVWIDHCTFQDSQDGALDSKVCDWATYTYNYFYYTDRSYSHAYTCGCGWVSNHEMVLHLTFARNIWGAGCQRRLPQCDDSFIHLVNNYHNCPGNSVGMTINSYTRALVEGNYAAAGVKDPLTGSGAQRNVTAKGNNFSYTSVGTEVTVPYDYATLTLADVPTALTGDEGAGAKLGNDATAILSTISTTSRGETTYVLAKGDAHIGSGKSITEVGGITVTFSPDITDWISGGSGSNAQEVDGVELTGYYAQSKNNNAAPIIIKTTQAGTLTIFLGGDVATSKGIYMTEGENGLTGKVLSSGAEIASGSKPSVAISAWDGLVYNLEANKTYTFYITSTKWRLAAIRYIQGTTGITNIHNKQTTDDATYTLQGVRVNNPKKGIYIRGGKKIIIK